MAAKNTNETTATFELFEEKKHSVRYKETGDSSQHVLGSIYVSKDHLTEPWPEHVTVTIKGA